MYEIRIEERIKCKKCEGECELIRILSTKKTKEQKRERPEILVDLQDVLILVYECTKCGSKFDKIIRGG